MKFAFYFMFILTGLSCGCLKKKQEANPWAKPVFPKTELREIIFRGIYHPEDPNAVKKIREDYIERGLLKKGETLKEKYPYLLDDGDENFYYTEKKYCYNETKAKDKNPPFKDHFRARLYDKEGILLSEDFLRLTYPDKYDEEGRYTEEYLRKYKWSSSSPIEALDRATPEDGLLESSRAVVSYLSYDERGYEIRVVKLKGRKELIIKSYPYPIPNKTYLIEAYVPYDGPGWGAGYSFNEKSQCHSSAA